MPYKVTRLESYKADQTKSGDSLKHYGRKGMKWNKNIFGKDDAPGQSRSSSNSGSAQPKKALSSALSSKVGSSGRGGSLNKNTLIQPEIPNSGRIMRVSSKSPFGVPHVEGYRTGKIPDPIIKSGGRGEAKPRSGLQKWFDQAGKDIGNTFNSAKKGVEDAANSVKKWGEGAVNDTKKWVEGAANDAKKWTDNAIKDIGKTAVKIGDDAKRAYGDAEKWVNGAIKDVGNAAVKVGDDAKKAYGDAKKWVDTAIGDTKKWVEGAASTTAKEVNALVDDIVNGRHSKRNRLREKAYDSKVKRDRVLARGNGPQLDEMDMNRAFSKAPYARSNSTELQRDTGRLRTENWRTKRSIAPKLKTPKVVGPSGSDAKKYLQGQGVKVYQDTVKQLSKNPNDKLALDTMEFFKNTINNRKREERDRK